jgi:hypothetical protein
MTPSPNTPRQPPRRGPAKIEPTQGEILWRSAFYGLSALMAALALTDFDAGRFAHGLGDAGVACLMLSLMTQFPFVRAMVEAGSQEPSARAREALLREAERLRAASPWPERLSRAGWMLLLSSFALRLIGAA